MKDIKVIVVDASIENDSYGEDCNCSLNFNQTIFSLDELFSESWFVSLLKDKGFYSKDELGDTSLYLDKFIYEYNNGFGDYKSYTNILSQISEQAVITAVYQEVIGPERLKAFAKWKKNREIYLAKQEDKKKKDLEKKRLKAIEKARKLLEKEKINVNS